MARAAINPKNAPDSLFKRWRDATNSSGSGCECSLGRRRFWMQFALHLRPRRTIAFPAACRGSRKMMSGHEPASFWAALLPIIRNLCWVPGRTGRVCGPSTAFGNGSLTRMTGLQGLEAFARQKAGHSWGRVACVGEVLRGGGKTRLHARRRRAGRRALSRSGRRVVTGRVRHQTNIHTAVFRAAV